jgi:hypothetical protein
MYLLNNALGSKGACYGSKMVSLECVGLLLPFLCIPGSLSGKVVVFHVDNIAVVYGWHNGASKIDEEASILLRGLHLMAAFLGTTVHVQHEPRRSSDLSILADNLDNKQRRLNEAEQGKMLGPGRTAERMAWQAYYRLESAFEVFGRCKTVNKKLRNKNKKWPTCFW